MGRVSLNFPSVYRIEATSVLRKGWDNGSDAGMLMLPPEEVVRVCGLLYTPHHAPGFWTYAELLHDCTSCNECSGWAQGPAGTVWPDFPLQSIDKRDLLFSMCKLKKRIFAARLFFGVGCNTLRLTVYDVVNCPFRHKMEAGPPTRPVAVLRWRVLASTLQPARRNEA
jgi:hypothetical protein